MRAKYGLILLWLLVFFAGCSESAYKPYVEAIENTNGLTAVHHLWVTDLPAEDQVPSSSEVMTSPLKENYSDMSYYWASLLDRNCVSEKGKTVVKTPSGAVKVTRYKVHPSSEVVKAFESYLKEKKLLNVHGEILSYEEDGLVDLDGHLVESTVSFVVKLEAAPEKKQNWKFVSQYGYEIEKGGQ